MDEIGRFKKIYDRRTMALPSEDFFTGRIDDEFYIDMDKDTDAGRIYIGQTTLEQLAHLIGWVPGELVIQQETKLQELEKENDLLRTLLSNLRDSAVSLVSTLDSQAKEQSGSNTKREPREPTEADSPASKRVPSKVSSS